MVRTSTKTLLNFGQSAYLFHHLFISDGREVRALHFIPLSGWFWSSYGCTFFINGRFPRPRWLFLSLEPCIFRQLSQESSIWWLHSWKVEAFVTIVSSVCGLFGLFLSQWSWVFPLHSWHGQTGRLTSINTGRWCANSVVSQPEGWTNMAGCDEWTPRCHWTIDTLVHGKWFYGM